MRRVGKFLPVAAAIGLALTSLPDRAQGLFVATLDIRLHPNDANQPFLLSSVPSDVTEAISDYRRYCGRSQWEKAFKQLEKVISAKQNSLVPDKQGIMVPPAVL